MTLGFKSKIYLPLLVLLVGAAAAWIILRARPTVERSETPVPPPLVRVIEVSRQDVPLDVYSQGTVEPRTESVLVSQVAGRIESVSSGFADGGFFREGEIMVRIDPRDYELAVSRAEAAVAQARVRLELERAEADVARQEWDELGEGEPTPLTLREPQLEEARANLQGAQAALEQAHLDLSRTVIQAPFDGRVREKRVDVGQFVSPGTPLATAYATDVAEVRLPVTKNDLGFLDLDLGVGGRSNNAPLVVLRGEIGGKQQSWRARVVRTESEFDAKTRMLGIFAEVEDPFGRKKATRHPPLPMGLFVEAVIRGKQAPQVVVLPRPGLRENGQVLVLDEEDRLRFRDVEVLRVIRDTVIVQEGLVEGERVCISPLETVVDGMKVRMVRADETDEISWEPESVP